MGSTVPGEPVTGGPLARLRDARRFEIAALVAVVAVIALVAGTTVWRANQPARRNVLLIMTDDQTLESIRVMTNLQSLIAAQGTTFNKYYTSTPNCCPSRVGFYTGQYPHNNGVKDNIPPLGGAGAFEKHKTDSLGPWLQDAGYYTAHLGKYLNGWGESTPPENWKGGIGPPPGWDHWFGLIDPSTYTFFNYRVSDDGRERTFGTSEADYQTDVFGAEVERSIEEGAASGKPWFVMWTPVAPHNGKAGTPEFSLGPGIDGLTTVPAPRHRGVFANEPIPLSPATVFGPEAVNSPGVQAKPAYIRGRVKNAPAGQQLTEIQYRAELESLLAVDEWIKKLYDKIDALGQLGRTDIIFTSDNGYFHGQHGLTIKGLLYEEAVHLPLVAKGPSFPAGAQAEQLALNIDLTATVLGITRAEASTALDGRDLRPLARDPAVGVDRAILLEQWYSFSDISTKALRLGNWSYMQWSTGETELYELGGDPAQQNNVAADPNFAPVLAELQPRLDALAGCRGATCEDSDAGRKR